MFQVIRMIKQRDTSHGVQYWVGTNSESLDDEESLPKATTIVVPPIPAPAPTPIATAAASLPPHPTIATSALEERLTRFDEGQVRIEGLLQ